MREIAAQMETENLLGRLRRTRWVARLSQGALAATLLLTATLWTSAPQPAIQASGQIAAKPVVMEASPQRMEVASFQLATELSLPTPKVAMAD